MNRYATPDNTADVIFLYVDGDVFAGHEPKKLLGITFHENTEMAAIDGNWAHYWDEDISDKFKGTLVVSGNLRTKATLAHELGHVLTLRHLNEEKAPDGDNDSYNLLTNHTSYTGNLYDSKRLRKFQEERVHNSQFVKEVE